MRLLFNSQLILQTHVLFIFYPSRGSCPRDPPIMIAYTSCRPLLRPLTVWSPNFDLNHFCFHYLGFHGFSSLIIFPYICIYFHFKFCCFASMCNTSMYVFVKRYTIHGLTYVTSVKLRDANLNKLTGHIQEIKRMLT